VSSLVDRERPSQVASPAPSAVGASLSATPSQTVGPFFSIGLTWADGRFVVPEGTADAIEIHGAVYDGAGTPVPDALVETWQADHQGRFGTSFRGFGRSATDERGAWSVYTLKPGRVPDAHQAIQAPHVDVSVFARGLLARLVTRIYFADELDANAADPVLARLPSGASRTRLMAIAGERGYRFDIHLQGARETVFFAV
jgi:protocatechuate 3,4-dioxygenase alpha subunit